MLDADKQAAINVFLGIADDRVITGKRLRFGGYDAWYDTKHLERPLYDTRKRSNGVCEFVDPGVPRRSSGWVLSTFAFHELREACCVGDD